MWADTLLDAERQHLLRLLAWAAMSILAGTAIFTGLAARRVRSALLTHFAMQLVLWGAVGGLLAYVAWSGLHFRDVGGAARLERVVWLNIGLDAGYFAVGATLATMGRVLERRMALVGAGSAIVVHGIAHFLLDVQFAALVSR